MTPEGVVGAVFAGDDRTLLAHLSDGSRALLPLGGSTMIPAKGLEDARFVAGRSRQPNSVFVAPPAVPLKVWRVNAASGVRTLVKTLALPDMSAINQIEIRHWSYDGPYAYSYARELSQLFIVSGVK